MILSPRDWLDMERGQFIESIEKCRPVWWCVVAAVVVVALVILKSCMGV